MGPPALATSTAVSLPDPLPRAPVRRRPVRPATDRRNPRDSKW